MTDQKQLTLPALFTAAALLSATAGANQTTIDINVNKPTVELSPVLYGLFFEDINYSGDGGLYPELVQNRSFEYFGVPGDGARGDNLKPLTAWEKIEQDGGTVQLEVVNETPLNGNNTKYLKMTVNGTAGVQNLGFAGMAVKQGEKYDFSVYTKATGNLKPISVAIVGSDGTVLAGAELPATTADWEKHAVELSPSATDNHARLTLMTSGEGELMLDMVSLFPQDTFNGRKNGLRPDLAQALADLNPGFLRFPGGCILHGQGVGNIYRWKDTLGDIAERKPNWNLWGYHQTYGLGYYEYMQLCEDIGATPLPVIPVGVTCGFRQPFDIIPMDELQPWIDDALDLIEFANGPADSKWGKVRAEMGHPEPFNLEYVSLGNEEHNTAAVRERFPLFVKAIRDAYPDIKIVGTSGLGPEIPLYDLMTETKVHSSDEHYYLPPSWYFSNTDRFDNFDRSKPKIFVGEYASEGNTMYNALSEAAYLTGIERNADMVDMTCYAPLFSKIGFTQWPRADLIWFDNTRLMKTPNYYVQQLFACNKGDVYLENKVTAKQSESSSTLFGGKVGIGTWRTAIEVEKASLNGKSLDPANWTPSGGTFVEENGLYAQRDAGAEGVISVSKASDNSKKIVYTAKARKTSGAEGFLVVFGYAGENDYYWWNVGGWNNTAHAIQHKTQYGSIQLIRADGSIENDRWYDLKIELTPGRIKCYLDGKLIHDYEEQVPELAVSPTLDKTNRELIVKIVNPSTKPQTAVINLNGVKEVAKEASLTVLSAAPHAVNTIDNEVVAPVTSTVPAGQSIKLELPGTSMQVLRVGVN